MLQKWDQRFFDRAKELASWSQDPSTKVGAVIVRPDKTAASEGFNGFPRKIADTPERLDNRKLKNQLMIHAEANAIIFAREPLEGYTIYLWPCIPCSKCAGLIIQTGILRVVSNNRQHTNGGEDLALTISMFDEAGVELILHDVA